MEKKTNVVMAFWEEVQRRSTAGQEALKFAGAHKLPILYVVKEAPAIRLRLGIRKYSRPGKFSSWHGAMDFPGSSWTADDVVAVWRVAQESIHRARNGAGPTLIDCNKRQSLTILWPTWSTT